MAEITRVVRAITICQPYSHLIVTPTEQLPGSLIQKRVENRTWYCNHRGPIAIHAGKGTKYMQEGDRELFPGLVFGAVLAIAEMVACVPFHRGRALPVKWHQYQWLAKHAHAEGPYCFVLERVQLLKLPYYTQGKQGLWNCEIPEELI